MNFLKNLFKRKPELEKEQVTQDELETWVLSKKKSAEALAQTKIDEKVAEIRNILDDLDKNIESLQNAKLMNPNIPEKAKHFMIGNREAFIKAAHKFKQSLSLPRLDQIKSFQKAVDASVKDFIGQIKRPFQILQEFFADESKKMLSNVNTVGKIASQMVDVFEETNLNSINELENTIEKLKNSEIDKQRYQEEMKKAELEVKNMIESVAEAQNSLKQLENSPEYQSLMTLKKELQSIISGIKQARSEMQERFSAIEPALKKYERITLNNQDFVRDYLANPIETLARDRDLVILSIVSAAKKELSEDRINLKERKKEKILVAMDDITADVLNDFLKNYGKLTREQQILIQKINKMDVLQRIGTARKQLETLSGNNLRAKNFLTEVTSKSQAVDPKAFIKEIQDLAREKLSIELKITTSK